MFATSRARNCENEEDANCRAISRAVARGFATLPKTRAQTNARTRERERRHALARAMLLRATSPRGQRKIRGTSSRVLRIG